MGKIKEFFRPTKGKITITIIIFLVTIGSMLIFGVGPAGGACWGYDEDLICKIVNYIFIIIFFPFFIFYRLIAHRYIIYFPFDIFLILNILYSYILSCLIVYIHNKQKTKKNTKK